MNKKQLSERDICTKFITPSLRQAGWDEITQVREEVSFTKGRIIVRSKLVTRGKAKRADYILYYKPNIPLAVIEAKDNNCSVGDGLQQALGYAETLKLPFAFSSNGDGFVFHDHTQSDGEVERNLRLDEFPSPAALWNRYREWKGLPPESESIVLQDYFTDGSARTPLRKQYDDVRSYSAGGPQPNLNVQKIKELLVPLLPLAEQQRIVAKVDELMAVCDKLGLSSARQKPKVTASSKPPCTRRWPPPDVELGPDRVHRRVRSPRLPHQQRQSSPEILLRLVQVVRSTPQFDVLDRRLTTDSMGFNVMELEEPALGTAPVRPHERAPAAVALPHLPPHGGRNVTRTRRDRSARTWMLGRRQLGSLEIRHEERQRPIEDGSRVASRDRVTQQVLSSAELVVRLTRDRELHLVALGSQRRHDRRARRRNLRNRNPIRNSLNVSRQKRGKTRWPLPPSLLAAVPKPGVCARLKHIAGWGRRRATMCSTSRLLLWRAPSRTSARLASVR